MMEETADKMDFFLKVWGVMCAFILASRVRQSKTERDVQRWATVTNPTLDTPKDSEVKSVEEREGDINYI